MDRACSIWMIALALSIPPLVGAEGEKYRHMREAHEHFYNLEYEKAIEAHQRQRAATPEDALVYNFIAAAYLYKEAHRLGKLSTSAFTKENEFLDWEKPDPDKDTIYTFKQYLYEGRRLAEAELEQSSTGPRTLYALSQNHGLEANYQLLIETAYFDALGSSKKATKYSRQAIELHPEYVDGYFFAGVHEYVLGSLPFFPKLMAGLLGASGDKDKGIRYVRRVAKEGDIAKDAARSMLAVILRREEKPLEAAKVIQGLSNDFPRNYLYSVDLGSLYRQAGETERALKIYRTTLTKVEKNQSGFGRMPEHYRKALQNAVQELSEERNSSAASLNFRRTQSPGILNRTAMYSQFRTIVDLPIASPHFSPPDGCGAR